MAKVHSCQSRVNEAVQPYPFIAHTKESLFTIAWHSQMLWVELNQYKGLWTSTTVGPPSDLHEVIRYHTDEWKTHNIPTILHGFPQSLLIHTANRALISLAGSSATGLYCVVLHALCSTVSSNAEIVRDYQCAV